MQLACDHTADESQDQNLNSGLDLNFTALTRYTAAVLLTHWSLEMSAEAKEVGVFNSCSCHHRTTLLSSLAAL